MARQRGMLEEANNDMHHMANVTESIEVNTLFEMEEKTLTAWASAPATWSICAASHPQYWCWEQARERH